MSDPTPASDKLSLIALLKLLTKWRNPLVKVVIGALIAAIIITMPLFMPPLYKATSVVYPANIQVYSKETQTEQLVQLLKSEDVWYRLINELKLYQHYNIDTTSSYPQFAIMKELEDNLSINKTEYESVEITAYDGDPKMAALMCNTLLRMADEKAIHILHERSAESIVVVGKLLNQKKAELDSLDNVMHELRTKYGIMDFENQISGFSREYYHALGNGGANSKMETDRINLEEKGGQYLTCKELLWKVRGSYLEYKLQYERLESDLNKELQFHNTISKAIPPQRKDSPKRTLIIIFFTLSVLFFAILYIIYIEFYKKQLMNELKDVR